VKKQTRRQFIKTAAVGVAAVSLPTYWRTTDAQPSLHLGLWNHWVPGANPMTEQLAGEWGKKNKVDVKIDFIGSNDVPTKAAAASRAGVGPDILALYSFQSGFYVDKFVACNDIMDRMIKKYGAVTDVCRYTLEHGGKWIGVPICIGSQSYPMVTRISLFKQHCGIDVQAMFPADVTKRNKAEIDKVWTYANFMEMAKKLAAAGVPYGNPMAECTDSCDWINPLFMSFGSYPANAKNEITLDTPETLEALTYIIELSKYMPKDIYGWDDASNNRHLISGRGAAIQNPPSAWAVAVKDSPDIGKDIWHHDVPAGPKGRVRGGAQQGWCLWQYSKQQKAALELMEYMIEQEATYALIGASKGFDQPGFKKFYECPVYAEVGPPVGTLYNYTLRGDEQLKVGGMPATPALATRIYSKTLLPVMCAKACTGEMKPKDAINWAIGQMEDYLTEI